MGLSKRLTVLVVDDEPSICTLIAGHLEPLGFSCRSTTRSVEAEQMLQHEIFDIAFVDVNMPVLDGIQLMRNVHEFGRTTAFILTSKSLTDAQRADCFTEGAKTILHKPFKPHELIYAVELVAAEFG